MTAAERIPATVLHIATGTLLEVSDPWAILTWLDRDLVARDPARDARWEAMQARKRASIVDVEASRLVRPERRVWRSPRGPSPGS